MDLSDNLRGERRRERHVSLGRRLEILQLIHSGHITCEVAAALMDVSVREIHRWQALHACDQIVSVGRPRGPGPTSEETHLLTKRVRLMRLLRELEANLRDLHAQLLAASREARGSTIA